VTCEQIEHDEVAEQYVLGRLSEDASAVFEDHYFGCSQCRERVEHLQSVRHALGSVGLDKTAARPRWGWWPAAGALAAAAVLVLAVRVMQDAPTPSPADSTASSARDVARPGPAATLDVAALGAVDPPSFTASRLRSSTDASRRAFLAAMEVYGRGDYAGAIAGLERAVRGDPAFPGARFFLAVCYLRLDRTPEAIDQLGEVTRLGESPYLEDAHFFLGKAFIRAGDADGARREWRTVVSLDGDRRAEASRLLARLP
jgi:tetratricopeptide (TPR) repeat protein